MAEHRGLAIAALALGLVGLFTGGLLIVGSLVGLVLAAAALVRASSRGQDVAWAALAANAFALLSVVPLSAAILAYYGTMAPDAPLFVDSPLPEPAVPGLADEPLMPAPPPPPPPPAGAASGLSRTPARVDASGSSPPLSASPSPPRAGGEAGKARGPSSGVAPVRISGKIESPRKTRHVSPVYPRAAVKEGVQGVVVLECTVSPQGKVVAVKVLRSVPLLDQAAIDAVRQWEYTPTLLDGVAVPVIMTVTVNFKLS